MKVTDHIEKAEGNTLFSFEVLPPMKGKSIEQLYETIDSLMEFDPSALSMSLPTGKEFVLKDRGNGLLERKGDDPQTTWYGGHMCGNQYKYKIDTVPHIICGGFTKEETEYALIDLNFLGIHNVLVLRGDAIRSEGVFRPDPNGHAYASELLEHVMDLNKGVYLHDEVKNNQEMDFCMRSRLIPKNTTRRPI